MISSISLIVAKIGEETPEPMVLKYPTKYYKAGAGEDHVAYGYHVHLGKFGLGEYVLYMQVEEEPQDAMRKE